VSRAKDQDRLNRRTQVTLSRTFVPSFAEQLDNRVAVVKEIRRRIKRLKAECGADSYMKELLCERAIFVALQLETMEVKALAKEDKFDSALYCQALNTLSGLLNKLGLEKQTRTIDLKAYTSKRA
jgi:hypothetical protein